MFRKIHSAELKEGCGSHVRVQREQQVYSGTTRTWCNYRAQTPSKNTRQLHSTLQHKHHHHVHFPGLGPKRSQPQREEVPLEDVRSSQPAETFQEGLQ
ncbi:hypothetical protein SAMN05421878_1106 [Actinobaculum suis]|uniref:Uncharacterized protein n=1 Tax=Actinobaculum suis TaxID=1657 RepID=A0A1G7D613_9ACTO|nr:hypothetical protein SAMN05421878_1106 [Actinobaculum suis]